MQFKLIIFDKDKTLVKPKSRGRFVNFPKDQVLLTGVDEKIQRLREEGVLMAIATNQGGVSAGHKSLGSAKAELSYVMKLTKIKHGILCPDMGGRRACALTPDGDGVVVFDNVWGGAGGDVVCGRSPGGPTGCPQCWVSISVGQEFLRGIIDLPS